jgi:hypothetical protein
VEIVPIWPDSPVNLQWAFKLGTHDNSLSCSLSNSTTPTHTGAWETNRRIFPKSQVLAWVYCGQSVETESYKTWWLLAKFSNPKASIPNGKTAFAGAKPESTLGSGSDDLTLIKKEVCDCACVREKGRENLKRDGGVGAEVFELGVEPGRHRRRRGRLPHRHQRHRRHHHRNNDNRTTQTN